MSALERIAHFQGRRDEVPNQELARDLAANRDRSGVREIAKNLRNKDKRIQADCIKVLYEVGYIEPALIAEYAEEFVALLDSKNNRMVWGGMTALGTVARLRSEVVMKHLPEIKKALNEGSVITVDNAVQTLAQAAAAGPKYNKAMFPILLDHLKTCRAKEVPQHAERTLPAAGKGNAGEFDAVLRKRMTELNASGQARVKKVLRAVEAGG
jgi:hypothetical protein